MTRIENIGGANAESNEYHIRPPPTSLPSSHFLNLGGASVANDLDQEGLVQLSLENSEQLREELKKQILCC